MQNKRIIIASGHAATTANALLEKLINSGISKSSLYWVASKKAMEGEAVNSLESKLALSQGVNFIPISAGKLQRVFSFRSFISILKIPLGFWQGISIVSAIKPSLIVSFGGFAAVPVVIAGALFRIPIFIHEQTTAAGIANRVSAIFAKKIFLAHSESMKYFSKDKTEIVGNPISSAILKVTPKLLLPARPTLFITCGSRGSQKLNEVILSALPRILSQMSVIHLTGDLDYKKFMEVKKNLKSSHQKIYHVYGSVLPQEIARMYQESEIIIARAGANTVSEILHIKRPAILIPLPFSYEDEQLKNALKAEKLGIAKVIEQNNLTANVLVKELEAVKLNWKAIVSRLIQYKSKDTTAAADFASAVMLELKN